jgi:hypothetical protein
MAKCLSLFLLAVLLSASFAGVACQPVPPTVITPSGSLQGTLSGVVTDDPVTKAPGKATQNYPGISVQVLKAVASGTYRTSADAPVRTNYVAGDKIAETVSGPDGRFSISLAPGPYLVRGSGGEKVYASAVLAEIKSGSTTEIVLHLNFGV